MLVIIVYNPVKMKHIAIFSGNTIAQIFSGKKTVELRFSQKRIAPFGSVSIGDTIFMKPPGHDIVGQFIVKKVISIEGLEPVDWKMISTTFGKLISLGSAQDNANFFKQHKTAKFATIIFISNVEQFITSPLKISKKDLRGWMILR